MQSNPEHTDTSAEGVGEEEAEERNLQKPHTFIYILSVCRKVSLGLSVCLFVCLSACLRELSWHLTLRG